MAAKTMCKKASAIDRISPMTLQEHSQPTVQAKVVFDEEAAFQQMVRSCTTFAKHLDHNQQAIAKVLSAYQSFRATEVEIWLTIECLTSLPKIQNYLNRRTEQACTFLPLNLPVYSLVLFAVIPALVTKNVHLRPPQKMTTVFSQLVLVLQLHDFFPNIHISFESREDFVKNYVTEADVIIFTGQPINARRVLEQTKRDSLFLFNGRGCNPIVVSSDAGIALAVSKAAEAKLLNSGQDCAGPDNMLIHQDIAGSLLQQLQQNINFYNVGDCTDPNVDVGKIAEDGAMAHLASSLLKHQSDIILGGSIDFMRRIVQPTVIVAPLSRKTNYEEFFSPIFFISVYDDDAQLAKYFEDPRYAANEMYVSLFGSSSYVEGLERSILIRNDTILDMERGINAYGGYSLGASFVATEGKSEARPILVPREISLFLEKKAAKAAAQLPQRLTSGAHKRIRRHVSKAMQDHFGSNLAFGFCFGSIAKGQATSNSDINTMVVLKTADAAASSGYLEWLGNFHHEMNMTVDDAYTAEIVTLERLHKTMGALRDLDVFARPLPEASYHDIVWTQVLAGTKRGLVGSEALLFQFAKCAGKFPKVWKRQIIEKLTSSASGLDPSTAADIAALSKLDPDAVQTRFVGLEFLTPPQREAIERRFPTTLRFD